MGEKILEKPAPITWDYDEKKFLVVPHWPEIPERVSAL